jgi:hypothetical protein
VFLFHQPLVPIVAEELNWMLRPNGAIPAPEVIGSAVFVTTPADAFGVAGVDREVHSANLLL